MGINPYRWTLGNSLADMYLSFPGPCSFMGRWYLCLGTKSEGPKNWRSGSFSPVRRGLSSPSGGRPRRLLLLLLLGCRKNDDQAELRRGGEGEAGGGPPGLPRS